LNHSINISNIRFKPSFFQNPDDALIRRHDAPRYGGYYFNALLGTGQFTSTTPDTILGIGDNRSLLFSIPAIHVNETRVHARLAAFAQVLVDVNLHIRFHRFPP
jgi:hypothetical protein